MAYCLVPHENPSEGLKRIAQEQLTDAIESATNPGTDHDGAIHDIRKRMKKLRAVLRMVRDGLGGERYTSENACFRDAAKKLAGLRETTVHVATVVRLKSHFVDQLAPEAFENVLESLKEHRAEAHSEKLEESNVLAEIAEELRRARDRVDDWPLKSHVSSIMAKGVRRVYRRGRKGLMRVKENPTDENFHEWRKRVKYLWYHARILEAAWPAVMGALVAELDALSDLLGEDHDLADVRAMLVGNPELVSEPSERDVLLGLIAQRQRELRAVALPQGARIYAENPAAFVGRLDAYWRTARAGTID